MQITLAGTLKMNKKESQHFSKLWELIDKSIEVSREECCEAFAEACGLERVASDKLKKTVEKEYRLLREELKQECYGKNEEGTSNSYTDGTEPDIDEKDAAAQSLDARKIAAVVCCALIRKKAFTFDEAEAVKWLKEEAENVDKKAKNATEAEAKTEIKIKYNELIVDNFFINYKIAYLAGLRIIFFYSTERTLG